MEYTFKCGVCGQYAPVESDGVVLRLAFHPKNPDHKHDDYCPGKGTAVLERDETPEGLRPHKVLDLIHSQILLNSVGTG